MGSLAGFRELLRPVSSLGGLARWASPPGPGLEPGRGWGRVRSRLLAVWKRLDRNSCTHLGDESLRGISAFSGRGSILGETPVDSPGDGGWLREGLVVSAGVLARALPCSTLSRTQGRVTLKSQDKNPYLPDLSSQ